MTIKLFEDDNNINLEELFNQINDKHFNGKITKIPTVWNKRLRVCAGKCFYRVKRNHNGHKEYTPTKIEMSYKLFENNNWDMDKIKTTLAHEMTHAFLAEHHNEVGHTDHFQRIMTMITGENKNHRCHQYNVDGLRNKRNIHYTCDCGLTYGRRARMPKRGLFYRSTCCGSKITFWKEEEKNINTETISSAANNVKNNDKGDDGFVPLF
mgnify:FL=1